VLGTRERVPGRQAVVDHPFVIGRSDDPCERAEKPITRATARRLFQTGIRRTPRRSRDVLQVGVASERLST
jgi:hypothetical protein